MYDHLFDVKYEHSVEDLERDSTLSSKDHDLLLSNLVGQAHIGRHPFSFVSSWRLNLLPYVSLDIVDFDYINNSFLVYYSS